MTTATNRDHVLDHAEGEWTPVRYGKSYRSRPHPRRCPSNLVANLRAGPSRTVPEIAAEYRGIYSWWKDSPCCAALRGLMAANARRSPPISRALCLGIGTFDPLDGGWEAKRRTFLQLIAFLVMVEELGTVFLVLGFYPDFALAIHHVALTEIALHREIF